MDYADRVGDDGLIEAETIADAAPLILVAAGALLTACAATAWVVSRALRSLGKFPVVLEDGYERKYTDGYWEH